MFGIKIAVTEEQKQECAAYCESKGVKILPGTGFVFIEVDGDVKAAAGWHPDLGGTIDPLVSEGISYTKTLAIFMYGYLVSKGYTHISLWTQDEDWNAMLQKEGFVSEKTNRLIIGA